MLSVVHVHSDPRGRSEEIRIQIANCLDVVAWKSSFYIILCCFFGQNLGPWMPWVVSEEKDARDDDTDARRWESQLAMPWFVMRSGISSWFPVFSGCKMNENHRDRKKKSGITASAWRVGINYESWIVMNCHELSTISRYLIVFRGCFGYLGPHNMVIFLGTSVQLKLEMWPWPPTRLFKVFAPCHIA